MPAERQVPAGRAGNLGIGFFWTPRGTEAPSAHDLFSWKLVRIRVCPAVLYVLQRLVNTAVEGQTHPRGEKRAGLHEAQQADLKEAHVMN